MIIEKKCWPQYFEKILSGDKNFELRINDFDCKAGDTLVLREFNPLIGYTGRTVTKTITYVLDTKSLNIWTDTQIQTYGFKILALKEKMK